MLVGKKPSCPANPCLHLIKDEKQTLFIAQVSQTFQIPRRRTSHPTFPLYGFKHDGTGRSCDSLANGTEIIERDHVKAFQQGVKSFPNLRLTCGR